ncbi:hypothetical protein FW320_06370 [Azospirillum sp. Vi22]|uniref:hypothetical protein n=1 Tax=Azospirillum baldaniorum TaxID=1064539 RepID=UPI00157A486F|nr:hypothetical protein [Azospirillum baldaniorum]NUB05800.1 hypothetical protein [Azospirillum baldaniorum]
MPDILIPITMEGETRIRDLDLAARLGFDRPRKIKELIERHMSALLKMGVCPTVGRTSGPQGGRPTEDFYLNRKQAIFITAKSETAEATDITIEIIEKFDAYERGAVKTKLDGFAARRIQVMEQNANTRSMQAANNALRIIGSSGGPKAIAKNAPAIYGAIGIAVDMSSAFDQGELELERPSEPEPVSPRKTDEGREG